MKNLMWLLLLCLPLFSVAQDIDDDLAYVNDKFAEYNEYSTSFDYSLEAGLLYFSDEFDVFDADVFSIEASVDEDNNVLIECTDGEYCLIGLEDNLESYSMGLTDANGPRIADVKEVVKRLNRIIQYIRDNPQEAEEVIYAEEEAAEIVEDDFSGIDLTKTTIAEDLVFVNDQFAMYNEYNTTYSMDAKAKTITCTDEFGDKVANAALIEIRLDDYNNLGLFCKDGSECIKGDDMNYAEYTMGLTRNVRNTVERLNAAQKKLLAGKPVAAAPAATTIAADLEYINQQFSLYNPYNTSYAVNETRKTIICKDKFNTFTVSAEAIGFNITGEDNDILDLYCIEGDECLIGTDENYSSYTMRLDQNAPQVVLRLKKVKSKLLASTKTRVSKANKATVDAKLKSMNILWANYSSSKIQWKADYNTPALIYNGPSCEVTFPLDGDLEFKAFNNGTSGYVFGFEAITSVKEINENCGSYKAMTSRSVEYLNSKSKAEEMIKLLKELAAELRK
jgi:hypothetical protein